MRWKDLKTQLPSDINIATDIFRQQKFIDSSIDNIKKSLYEGALFVIIVLFFFLMNVRTTLISLVTIPLSLLVSILTLKFMGLTINTMSIGGMAIAIGSLVDDAIVDVENVFKHLRQNRKLPESERQSIIQVVFNASREVRLPILNSTFIIVVSFIPLFFLTGMEGPYAQTARNCLYHSTFRLHIGRIDIDSGALQLPSRQRRQRQGRQGSGAGEMASEVVRRGAGMGAQA